MGKKNTVMKINPKVKAVTPKVKAVTPKVKAVTPKVKAVTPKVKAAKSKSKKVNKDTNDDMGIVIVDDDITIDQEKVNEERRAYLEESRSQDAYD
jgi:outer membrane murein-binding lipoprotein Lpp